MKNLNIDRTTILNVVIKAMEMDPINQDQYIQDKLGKESAAIEIAQNLIQRSKDASLFIGKLATIIKSSPTEFETIAENQILDKYLLKEKLGEGGMGEVWRAQQLNPVKREVALKLIKPGIASAEAQIRFHAERQALAAMNHPNVSNVFEADVFSDGRSYIAMEYIVGKSLIDYSDSNRLTLRQRLLIFLKVCSGLGHLHQKQFLHRDIKPTNILVFKQDKSHVPKIIDLGISEQISTPDDFAPEIPRSLAGTPKYMSPEQKLGMVKYNDTRSDIYSLGLVLLELIYGSMPEKSFSQYSADITDRGKAKEDLAPSQVMRITDEICAKRNTTSKKMKKYVSGDLDYIILKATNDDIEKRYSSIQSFANDIDSLVNNQVVAATPISYSQPLLKFYKRNRALVNIVLGAALLLILTTTTYVSSVVNARNAAEEDQQRVKQTLSFMVELFDSANPNNGLGKILTAEEMLKFGTDSLSDTAIDDPLVKAQILRSIGDSYHGLGKYDNAIETHQKSLELIDGLLVPNGVEKSLSLNSMALSYLDLRNYREAYDYLLQSLDILKTSKIKNDMVQAMTLTYLGSAAPGIGKHNEGLEYLENARWIISEKSGRILDPRINREQLLALTWANTAQIHLHLNDSSDAEYAYRRVIEISKLANFKNSPFLATASHGLGLMYYQQGRFEEANDEYIKSIKYSVDWIGSDHPDLAITYGALGKLQRVLGNYNEALVWYEKAQNIERKTRGIENAQYWYLVSESASIIFYQGDFDQAEKLFRQSLDNYDRLLDPGHWSGARTRMDYADLLLQQKRFQEAHDVSQKAVEIASEAFPEEHWFISAAYCRLGESILGLNDIERAIPLLKKHANNLLSNRHEKSLQYRYARKILDRTKNF